jgi:hypothetical protein
MANTRIPTPTRNQTLIFQPECSHFTTLFRLFYLVILIINMLNIYIKCKKARVFKSLHRFTRTTSVAESVSLFEQNIYPKWRENVEIAGSEPKLHQFSTHGILEHHELNSHSFTHPPTHSLTHSLTPPEQAWETPIIIRRMQQRCSLKSNWTGISTN